MLKRFALALALAAALVGADAAGQKMTKHWSEWSRKDVEKILDDSAWGQTQIETDISEMFYTPTTQGQGRQSSSSPRNVVVPGADMAGANNRAEQGALNQATNIKFHIRWLTARPVRRAIARQIELERGSLPDALRAFANDPIDERVVVAVSFDTSDQRFGGKVMQGFNSAVTETLKNVTYLERKDGRRIFLQQYIPPKGNALGVAMFVFPRRLGEGPLLTAESGDVRFVSDFSKSLKLNMRFKVSDMVYEGRLEY